MKYAKFLVICLALISAVVGCTSKDHGDTPSKTGSRTKAERETASLFEKEGQGQYLSYKYFYAKEGDQMAVHFSPFLPRNDATVIGAMKDVISTIYGERVVDATPSIVTRRGTNLIKLKGDRYSYLFLLIKEDTGEVHSFGIIKEKK